MKAANHLKTVGDCLKDLDHLYILRKKRNIIEVFDIKKLKGFIGDI